MELTSKSIRNPAVVGVVVTIFGLLGVLSIFQLPVQLFPNIERPVISVNTNWRAATPREVEAELAEPLEEVLQGMPGMLSMTSNSGSGGARVFMEFSLDTDINQSLIEVISRLNRLPPLPVDADPPRVNFGGGRGDANSLLWIFAQQLPNRGVDQARLATVIQDVVIPRLESIDGVAGVDFGRGRNALELEIVFDPYRAAQLGINLANLSQQIGRANDVSGGSVDEGGRSYALRFTGRYQADQLSELIIAWRDGVPIHLRDIADIGVVEAERDRRVYQNGNPAQGFRVMREPGANVLAAIEQIDIAISELNDGVLQEHGVALAKSFDPSVFIKRAVKLLGNNLLFGMMLAIGVLWWFLRQGRATLLIAATIPICLTGTFVVLNAFGRSVNVISLAGLAFATGMVMDAAIVVLENIVRLRENGHSMKEAAETGAKQVWGALLASTITTVMVFTPIIFLRDVEGQLFADLALTIAIAVAISLIVAVTVLPTAASKLLRRTPKQTDEESSRWGKIADNLIMLTGSRSRQAFWIVALILVPVVLTVTLWPVTNYLPPVKRDAIDGFVRFPSGSKIETIEEEYVGILFDRLRPYMDGDKEPALRNYYFFVGGADARGSLGVRIKDQNKVSEIMKIMREEIFTGLPGVQAFVQQGNLFGGFGGGTSIRIDLGGPDLDGIALAAADAVDLVNNALPGVQARLDPDPQVVLPEIRLIPEDRRIAETGLTREQVSRVIRALGDGLFLGEHFDGQDRLDIIMRADDWSRPETLETIPIALPGGGIASVGELVRIERTVGPTSIQRIDGRRTISVEINPPDTLSLEETVAKLKAEVEPALKQLLPPGTVITYAGSADSLSQAIKTIGLNFLVAVALLFMIMAALFKSLKDALLVVITLPMATVGGVLALKVLNIFTFSPLDLLGMIGFIITLGLVVNNAILLVAQTRASEQAGKRRIEAVREALRLRLRPIFMSTLTSIAGMLPLVFVPGAGSLIYRGMAVVIAGGMSVSTLFTLLLLPSLLQLGHRKKVASVSEEEAPSGLAVGNA